MSRFLRRFALCAIPHLLAFVAIVGVATSRAARSYLGSTIDKHRHLEQSPRPRLILVGGSSVAFGVDSRPLAESVGRFPSNMGITYLAGLAFILGDVERELEPGDVVLLTIEYHLLAEPDFADEETLLGLAMARPAALGALDGPELRRILDRGVQRMVGRIVRKGSLSAWSSDDVYRRDGFDADGDMVAHHGLAARSAKYRAIAPFSERTLDRSVARLNAFGAKAAKRGVRVFWVHPPFSRAQIDVSRERFEAIASRLERDLRIPMLDRAVDSIYPDTCFFDLGYHLMQDCARERTQQLAVALGAALAAPR